MARKWSYTTGVATINVSVTNDRPFRFEELRLSLAASSTAASIITTINVNEGANYDMKLNAQLMSAKLSYQYQPTNDFFC